MRIASLLWFALASVLLLILVGLAAPYVNAGAFRARIQAALEDSLGRKVQIEAAHFSLFSGPGFTLDNVTIEEDPHYGLESFAYIPTLEVRIRLDKLLLGQIRLLGLRMNDASLNLVKSDDGKWNAVELVERVSAHRSTPLNFFPAVQMSNARIDFKLGTRKTTLYITDTDLSIYPESSGKIYFKFEGSPARTDRAGNGFGHVVGTANWYLRPASATANELEADVNLQPSNLSELATLVEGQDLGVHGTVSAHVLISGPFADLHALGALELQDVHRWDLLPAPGDSLRVRFNSTVNLRDHTLELATIPQTAHENPFQLQLRANDFMTQPRWSVLATMSKAPLASLLPLARRMGMALPAGLQMDGALDGVVGYSNSAGTEGGVVITNAVANIPNLPPLRSASANVTISGNKIHIDPAILQSDTGGAMRAGGDFDMDTQQMVADIGVEQYSAAAFKDTTNAWFGAPEALSQITDAILTGRFLVSYSPSATDQRPAWSGQVQFANASVAIPGVAMPVEKLQGKATFDPLNFELPHMTGVIDSKAFSGSYRYNAAAKHPERLHLEFAKADLSEIEDLLAPALADTSLLSRLHFTRRHIPAWLSARNVEGDLSIANFSLRQTPLGPMSTHYLWQGTSLQLSGMQVGLPSGKLQASGNVSLAAQAPRYHLAAKVNGYQWGGGVIAADGILDTSGLGIMTLQHLQAEGKFSGADVTFPNTESFDAINGQFTFGFDGDTPALKLTKVEARRADDSWTGTGAGEIGGKLRIDLTSGERQLHAIADIAAADNANRP